MLHLALTTERLEAALMARQLACPDCAGPLSPWGHARPRPIRQRDHVRVLTPRRAHCPSCTRTHVLCPGLIVPRRRDSAEVIGEALTLASEGLGHRPIARQLARPEGTVRGWLRAARSRAELLRVCATRWMVALDTEPGPVAPAGSRLADAIEAIMLAVRAWRLRFGTDATGPWERAVCLTGGLLSGLPPPPR